MLVHVVDIFGYDSDLALDARAVSRALKLIALPSRRAWRACFRLDVFFTADIYVHVRTAGHFLMVLLAT